MMGNATRRIVPPLAVLALLWWGARGAVADYIVDQAHEDPGNGPLAFDVAVPSGAYGQGFRPTLNAVDVVEIYLSTSLAAETSIVIEIREGSIDGALLGTSEPEMFPPPFNTAQFVRFDFAAPVPLTPGELYVLRPVGTPQPNETGPLWFAQLDGTYAPASAVSTFQDLSFADFLFREGLRVVPEPSGAHLLGLGGAGLLVLRRSSLGARPRAKGPRGPAPDPVLRSGIGHALR